MMKIYILSISTVESTRHMDLHTMWIGSFQIISDTFACGHLIGHLFMPEIEAEQQKSE